MMISNANPQLNQEVIEQRKTFKKQYDDAMKENKKFADEIEKNHGKDTNKKVVTSSGLKKLKLSEKMWQYNLKTDLRSAIESENLQSVWEALNKGYEELHNKGIIDDVDYEEFVEELSYIDPEYAEDEDDCLDDLDYALNDFYDLCDNLDVWIPLNESINEKLELKEFKFVDAGYKRLVESVDYSKWEEFKNSDKYKEAFDKWVDYMIGEGFEQPFSEKEFDSTTMCDDAYYSWLYYVDDLDESVSTPKYNPKFEKWVEKRLNSDVGDALKDLAASYCDLDTKTFENMLLKAVHNFFDDPENPEYNSNESLDKLHEGLDNGIYNWLSKNVEKNKNWKTDFKTYVKDLSQSTDNINNVKKAVGMAIKKYSTEKKVKPQVIMSALQ